MFFMMQWTIDPTVQYIKGSLSDHKNQTLKLICNQLLMCFSSHVLQQWFLNFMAKKSKNTRDVLLAMLCP